MQDIISLLLEHHHSAEPQNTQQQAGQFQEAAKALWDVVEAVQADAAAGGATDCGASLAGAAEGMQLTDALLGGLLGLERVRTRMPRIE